MIRRACYVACDGCGDPAEVSVNDAAEAREFARQDGFVRVRRDGQLVDLCLRCRPDQDGTLHRMPLGTIVRLPEPAGPSSPEGTDA